MISFDSDESSTSVFEDTVLRPALERLILTKRVHQLSVYSLSWSKLKNILYEKIPKKFLADIHFSIGQILMSIIQNAQKNLVFSDLSMEN